MTNRVERESEMSETTYDGVTEMMAHEERMMSRPIVYRNLFETVFRGGMDDSEHKASFLVYDVPHANVPMTRFAVFVDGVSTTGGIIA